VRVEGDVTLHTKEAQLWGAGKWIRCQALHTYTDSKGMVRAGEWQKICIHKQMDRRDAAARS